MVLLLLLLLPGLEFVSYNRAVQPNRTESYITSKYIVRLTRFCIRCLNEADSKLMMFVLLSPLTWQTTLIHLFVQHVLCFGDGIIVNIDCYLGKIKSIFIHRCTCASLFSLLPSHANAHTSTHSQTIFAKYLRCTQIDTYIERG